MLEKWRKMGGKTIGYRRRTNQLAPFFWRFPFSSRAIRGHGDKRDPPNLPSPEPAGTGFNTRNSPSILWRFVRKTFRFVPSH